MRVSVVIPTYNCASFVNEAVESALAQSRPPAEVIVVDDGSTDNTEERLRPYAKRIRYLRKDNGGVSTARNRGLREANGDLIAFLDSDDVWHPQKLEFQVECLHKNPDLGLLGTRKFDWPKERFISLPKESDECKLTEIPFEDLAIKNVFTTSAVIIRQSVAEKVGEFDPTLRGPEDYDYWLRCFQVTRGANLELPLTGYRTVPGSLGNQAVNMEAGMQRILQKLDSKRVWDGRGLLRRRAYGYFHFSCGYMHHAAGHARAALIHLIRSICYQPFPMRKREVAHAFARPRLLSHAAWAYLCSLFCRKRK